MFFLALFLSSVERLRDKGTNTIGSRLNRMEEKVSTWIFVLQPEQGLAHIWRKHQKLSMLTRVQNVFVR